jgi:lysozyme
MVAIYTVLSRVTLSRAGNRALALAVLLGGCAHNTIVTPPSSTLPSELNTAGPGRLTAGLFLDERGLTRAEVRPPSRDLSIKGVTLTKAAEGFVPTTYNDAAHYCTIGYGHLIQFAPCNYGIPVEFRREITEERGTQLLKADLARAQWSVESLTTTAMTDGQYAALCDFVYNVGPRAYEHSTLRAVVNNGLLKEVPAQLRRWVVAGKRIVPGLAVRRESEIELFFDGIPTLKSESRASEGQSLIDIEVGEQSN